MFGSDSIITTKTFDIGAIKNLAFLLYGCQSNVYSLVAIALAVLLCLLQLSKFRVFLVADLILWFLILNLHNKIYPTLTGGDYLLNQLLLFGSFISGQFFSKKEFRVFLHNLFSIAIIAQICVVYLLSGLNKTMDEFWQSGKAISMLSHIRHFSTYSFHELLSIGSVSKIIGFLIIAYQLCFPLLVWISKIKKWFLVIGILMHLYIAFVMGLMGFGFIMILSYAYFWPFKHKI